jgi:hypothetical protein
MFTERSRTFSRNLPDYRSGDASHPVCNDKTYACRIYPPLVISTEDDWHLATNLTCPNRMGVGDDKVKNDALATLYKMCNLMY